MPSNNDAPPGANVSLLLQAPLSPQQVLVGTLHDPDFADIEAVIVVQMLKEGGAVNVVYSNMRHADLAYMVQRLTKAMNEAI